MKCLWIYFPAAQLAKELRAAMAALCVCSDSYVFAFGRSAAGFVDAASICWVHLKELAKINNMDTVLNK